MLTHEERNLIINYHKDNTKRSKSIEPYLFKVIVKRFNICEFILLTCY